ncbi:acyl-coenzyme A diphosphatase NUDT19 [Amia ocellicauda]|uniref:acyl-coenzyme A diphosphatase NUDT19 n=1 Tax=Amia ocellicauda TaxID=2972642 RepID=UPI00346425C7|nr:NUD19 protein [Amia calva]
MNTALKHWKEAATVIFVAGTRHRAAVDITKRSPVTSPSYGKSGWPHKSAFDYEVLLLKRSGKSGFMPNAYVFPGGLVDSSDFSSDWLDIFKCFRHSPNFGLGVVKQPPHTRPALFATDRASLGSPIPGDVAFRICAVRETFEESGILLVLPTREASASAHSLRSSDAPPLTRIARLCDAGELAKWRLLVNENPFNFIQMCKELDCVPNIWAMHEWGNWLTPTGIYGKERRYDTAFFICCLQDVPHTMQDEKEIEHYKWSTPSEILHSYQAREIWIAPPQFYDLGRMCHLPQLRDLHSFSRSRALEGCEQWLPVRLVSSDCYISLLPGDDKYPDNPDCLGLNDMNMVTEKTLEELQQESSVFHRIVFQSLHEATIHVNIMPKYKHLLPFANSSWGSQADHKSHL